MGNQGRNLVSFALSQLLITHSDTSSSLARRSVPLSAVGYLSLSIHKCRTYYLNPRLPSVSNQPSTSDIHINKSQNQEEYEEYSEFTEAAALLNQIINTYPITLDPESCEQHDDLCDDFLMIFFLIRKCQKQHSRTNKTLMPVI